MKNMDFILNKKCRSYQYKRYRFLPEQIVSVVNEQDIFDLLKNPRVKVFGSDLKEKKNPFIQEKKAEEGQLKIGVFRVGGIGDTLQLGAHCQAIKRKFPNSFLSAYVRDAKSAEVMKYNRFVNRTYQVGVASWDKLVDLHSKKHDIFYDFRYAVKIIFNTNKFPEYKKQTDEKFLEYKNIYKDFCKSNYKIERYGKNLINFSNMVACLEGSTDDLTFDLKENSCGYAKSLERQQYITIHVSCGKFRETKSWFIERWTNIVNYLVDKGYTVVQVGDKGETLICNALNLLGLTNIQETAHIIKGASYHIDTEGGIVHLAKAVKTPSIVIFGSTPVEAFGYTNNINLRSDKCSPCWYKTKDWNEKCPNGYKILKCLDLITIDMVKKSIDKFNKEKIKDIHEKPIVSIIIPVFNQLKYFDITISSILNNTKENIEIIIIDNGSNQEIKDYLNKFKQSKMIKIITNEKNLGFSKANNQGAKIAEGKYLCFLNSDVKVGKDWLKKLIEGIEECKSIGMVGVSGGKLDRNFRCVGIIRNNKELYNYLEGWCFLIYKEIFEKLNGFDEDFTPAFSEDADLSLRLRRSGYRTKIVEDVNIQHYGNKTVFGQNDFNVEEISFLNSKKLKEKMKILKR